MDDPGAVRLVDPVIRTAGLLPEAWAGPDVSAGNLAWYIRQYIHMPTTVHIPAALLKSVDRRAKALRVSRNRLIVKALEQAVNQRAAWAPEFLERLRDVDDDTMRAVDELLDDVKEARRSKPPREL